MVNRSPINLDSIKLRLINTGTQTANDPLFTKDGIQYLLKALIYADAEFSAEIETALFKAGSIAIPRLIKSLGSEHINVQSVAAMTLIRMGADAEESLLRAYPKYAKRSSTRWIFHFIFQELGLEVPFYAQGLVVSDSTVGKQAV